MRPLEPFHPNPTEQGSPPESALRQPRMIMSQDDWMEWMAEEVRRERFIYPPVEN